MLTNDIQLCMAETQGASFMDILLSSCVSVARSLRLHSTEALEYLCTDNKQRVMVQRACWLLDCIDKEYAMRTCKFEVRGEVVNSSYVIRQPLILFREDILALSYGVSHSTTW